jgi:hypothetical protein
MKRLARACFFAVSLAAGTVANVASADGPTGATSAAPERAASQGIAVFAIGSNANEESFAAARAVYGSRLRPAALDEVRARVLAGGAPPANASRELRELAAIRAGVNADDAAGRRLLAGIGKQIGVEALLVVKVESAAPAATGAPATIGAPTPSEDAADGGADAGENAAGNAAPVPTVIARLFLVDTGDFDAARYSPDPGPRAPAAWKSTVTSLEARFPGSRGTAGPAAATRAAPQVKPEGGKSSPFYASGWFWGAVGGAALLATVFYFASRDTSSDTIHLQMTVPK